MKTGDRVTMTPLADRQKLGPRDGTRTGTVIAPNSYTAPYMVRVRLDGRKKSDNWHRLFWRLIK